VPAIRRTADRSPLTACGMLNKKFQHLILRVLVVPSPLQLGIETSQDNRKISRDKLGGAVADLLADTAIL
jgi:hypothetical protein